MAEVSTPPQMGAPPSSTEEQSAAGAKAQEAKDAAQDKAQEVAGQVQEKAGEAKQQASTKMREQVDQRSTQAGEQVTTTATDLRTVGDSLREQGKDKPAQLADKAAERTEQLGTYLTESNADKILGDIEDFARKQPWAVVAGGLALGFVASRFMKASSSQRYSQRSASPYAGQVRPVPERTGSVANGYSAGTVPPAYGAGAVPPPTGDPVVPAPRTTPPTTPGV